MGSPCPGGYYWSLVSFLFLPFLSPFSLPPPNCSVPPPFTPKALTLFLIQRLSPKVWPVERRLHDQARGALDLGPDSSLQGRSQKVLQQVCPPFAEIIHLPGLSSGDAGTEAAVVEAKSFTHCCPKNKQPALVSPLQTRNLKTRPVKCQWSSFSQAPALRKEAPLCCRGIAQVGLAAARPCPKQSPLESMGSLPYTLGAGACRQPTSLPTVPTFILNSSLVFQDYQTHCFNRTRIFNISCPEDSSLPSHGDFFSCTGRSGNPLCLSWETSLSHCCSPSNI